MRECTDCFKAEYMKKYVGEHFKGLIVSVTSFGFFVQLANSCEGLVSIESLRDNYEYDGGVALISYRSGKMYKVGDTVDIKVAKVNINQGNVDFVIV